MERLATPIRISTDLNSASLLEPVDSAPLSPEQSIEQSIHERHVVNTEAGHADVQDPATRYTTGFNYLPGDTHGPTSEYLDVVVDEVEPAVTSWQWVRPYSSWSPDLADNQNEAQPPTFLAGQAQPGATAQTGTAAPFLLPYQPNPPPNPGHSYQQQLSAFFAGQAQHNGYSHIADEWADRSTNCPYQPGSHPDYPRPYPYFPPPATPKAAVTSLKVQPYVPSTERAFSEPLPPVLTPNCGDEPPTVFTHHTRSRYEPYHCVHQGCMRTFGTSNDRDQHMSAKHSERREFPCGVNGCEKAFYRKDKWMDPSGDGATRYISLPTLGKRPQKEASLAIDLLDLSTNRTRRAQD